MNKFCIQKYVTQREPRFPCHPEPGRRATREAGRNRRKVLLGFFGLLGLFGILPLSASAQELSYQYGEQVFTVMPLREWKTIKTVPAFAGRELVLEGELPEGIEYIQKITWDPEKIATVLTKELAEKLNREAGSVIIKKNEEGEIVFEGVALPGRKVDIDLATAMTVKALEEGISTIQLPVLETEPEIVVDDAELRELGIAELVTVGESNYSRSPANRRFNIDLGLQKFNGHLIPKGEEFSFNAVLGIVNKRSGFLKELTIMGEKTLPEYGGGLCQVSTTAYRGVWKGGFPITSRRNHSYAVRYYAPAGTDATIYPPWTDMRFMNDTDGALLIQTHHEGDNAYFLYYGTKPKGRSVELVGPFNFDHKDPPEDRFDFTEELPMGEKRILSRAVPGMKTQWYRFITQEDGSRVEEESLSEYAARPYYEEMGIALALDPLFSPKKPAEEVIIISEETKITVPRRGKKPLKIRR